MLLMISSGSHVDKYQTNRSYRYRESGSGFDGVVDPHQGSGRRRSVPHASQCAGHHYVPAASKEVRGPVYADGDASIVICVNDCPLSGAVIMVCREVATQS